jgi:hypothetical protein
MHSLWYWQWGGFKSYVYNNTSYQTLSPFPEIGDGGASLNFHTSGGGGNFVPQELNNIASALLNGSVVGRYHAQFGGTLTTNYNLLHNRGTLSTSIIKNTGLYTETYTAATLRLSSHPDPIFTNIADLSHAGASLSCHTAGTTLTQSHRQAPQSHLAMSPR